MENGFLVRPSPPPIIFSSARINFFQDIPYQHVLSDKNLEADSSDSSSFSLRFKNLLVTKFKASDQLYTL
jgi:hypothetical protein